MDGVSTLRVFFLSAVFQSLGQSHVTKTSQDGRDFRHPILFAPKEFLVDVVLSVGGWICPVFRALILL